jgi:sucrose phosphorylase
MVLGPTAPSTRARCDRPAIPTEADSTPSMTGRSRPNRPQLIAYADRLAHDIDGVRTLLDDTLSGAFGGVHLLPFFVPIDGADAGFDPIDHTRVDPRIGSWDDIAALGERYDVMADVIVNHISAASIQFQDWLARGDRSPTAQLFLTPERVFGHPPSEADTAAIHRPRPTSPFTEVTFADGSVRSVWTTFTDQQIDIDVEHELGWSYLMGILDRFARSGVGIVRLDAVGYAIKRAGTSCFMLPDTFAFIDRLTAACHERSMLVLVEIHGHHLDQIDIARRVDLVYDFALPPLTLDALFAADADPLKRWIGMRPNNAVNVLDTHDGIGVIDVGVDPRDRRRPGLLSEQRIDDLVEGIHRRSNGTSRLATGSAASNLDLYQVNCTFYDALGRDDDRYLAARMIQLVLPGTPQIYYVGLLAGGNDMELLAESGVGRDVNRHRYSAAEIAAALERPVVRRLVEMLRWRASEPAFDGTFELLASPEHQLSVRWTAPESTIGVTVDLRTAEIETTTG